MFETARRRVTTAIIRIEAFVFIVAVSVFFVVNLAQGLPAQTLPQFGFAMLLLIGVFFMIWGLGFIAATRGRMAALGSIALRLAVMVLLAFFAPGGGLFVAMLILVPTTLLLLVSAASKRNPSVESAGKVELGRP